MLEKKIEKYCFHLNNFLESLVNTEGKRIVICDEMNRLFEHADDPHYDTEKMQTLFGPF